MPPRKPFDRTESFAPEAAGILANLGNGAAHSANHKLEDFMTDLRDAYAVHRGNHSGLEEAISELRQRVLKELDGKVSEGVANDLLDIASDKVAHEVEHRRRSSLVREGGRSLAGKEREVRRTRRALAQEETEG